jgi:hypothetical protein
MLRESPFIILWNKNILNNMLYVWILQHLDLGLFNLLCATLNLILITDIEFFNKEQHVLTSTLYQHSTGGLN